MTLGMFVCHTTYPKTSRRLEHIGHTLVYLSNSSVYAHWYPVSYASAELIGHYTVLAAQSKRDEIYQSQLEKLPMLSIAHHGRGVDEYFKRWLILINSRTLSNISVQAICVTKPGAQHTVSSIRMFAENFILSSRIIVKDIFPLINNVKL